MNLDFSNACSIAINLNGWPARFAIAISVLLGHHLTLVLCQRLPLRNALGLMSQPKYTVWREGNWALIRHIGEWYSFTVARANTDAQLNMFTTGVLIYPLSK